MRTFVQDLNRNLKEQGASVVGSSGLIWCCYLVTLANAADDIVLVDLDVVERDGAGAARTNAKLLLLLRNGDLLARNDEAGDTLVALLGRDVGKNEEDFGFPRICDPPAMSS